MTRKHQMLTNGSENDSKNPRVSNYIRVNVEKNISMIAGIIDIKKHTRMFKNLNLNLNPKSKKKYSLLRRKQQKINYWNT